MLQSDVSIQENPAEKHLLYSFQTKPTGQFSNSEVLELEAQEKVEEIGYCFERGLKYLRIKTDRREKTWGVKSGQNKETENCLKVEPESDCSGILGPLRFGFSLNGNKFGALNFVVY